jgi:hypothetical protein
MLDNHSESFTFIQIHGGDGFEIPWGTARRTFYQVPGYPTYWFDGVFECIGAYPTVNQQYNWYQTQWSNRQAVSTDVKVELSGRLVSGQTYEFTATVMRDPGSGYPKTMRVTIVRLLDHWPNTGGYHRNGLKEAATSQDFTLDPGEGGQLVRTVTFEDESWNRKEDIRIVAFAQKPLGSPPADIYNAVEMSWPFAEPCRLGTVGLGMNGAPVPVLTINGSVGSLNHRRVEVTTTDAFEIHMDAPPHGPESAKFVLYGWFGEPTESTVTPQPAGIGETCFPTPLTGGSQQLRKIWNNIGKEGQLGTPDFPSDPAPSVVYSRPSGVGKTVTGTFQGLILDDASAASKPASVTNAVIVVSQ